MRIGRAQRAVALLAGAALTVTACGGRGDSTTASGGGETSPGITDTEVKLGGSYPFSGPASAYGTIGKGAQAYFSYVNAEKGGVKMGDGKTRKINFVTLDDGYSPPKAVENVRNLVQQEQVFALFNVLGTPNVSATWDYANQQKVPQLFVATGASAWGADVAKHPYTTGWQPSYPIEAALYADFLKKDKPNAKVAVLWQNDDFGKDLLDAFKKAIAGSSVTIVADQSYAVSDPTVDSQVSNLRNSNADTFLSITTPKFGAQSVKKVAELGWKPTFLLNTVAASKAAVLAPAGLQNAEGIYSAAYYKEVADPKYANDPAMQLYRSKLGQYAPGSNAEDPFNVFGFAVAETMVKTLERTTEPNREALMKAARSLKDIKVDLLLPGIEVETNGEQDGFPIEGLALEQFRNGNWVVVGEVTSYEGKTKSFIGEHK